MATVTVPWWLLWVVAGLAVCGFWGAVWLAAAGLRLAWNWLRYEHWWAPGWWRWWRDRVTPLLEDDDGMPYCEECGAWHRWSHGFRGGGQDAATELTRLGLPPDHDWDPDCRVQGCPVHGNWLPPERTWEQMTSHQLPAIGPSARIRDWLERDDPAEDDGPDGCVVPSSPESASAAAAMRTPIGTLTAARERRAPWWEYEHRSHYVAMGLEYPSGLVARVREAAQ